MKEAQPLGRDLDVENIDTGRVTTGPGEAGNKTELDRVFADAENDRDRRGRGFGRKRRRVAAGCGNHGNAAADEVTHERRQAIILACQPVVFDGYVLTFDDAGLVEAFAERCGIAR
jgi:hypothetical protein